MSTVPNNSLLARQLIDPLQCELGLNDNGYIMVTGNE